MLVAVWCPRCSGSMFPCEDGLKCLDCAYIRWDSPSLDYVPWNIELRSHHDKTMLRARKEIRRLEKRPIGGH